MANISHFTQTVNGVSTTYDIHDANAVPRSGGAVISGEELYRTGTASSISIGGGTAWDTGGMITLYGTESTTNPGVVFIQPIKSLSNKSWMYLNPNGTWTWSGQPCQTSSDQRLKQQISQIDDKLLDAWEDVTLCQFKYNDAVDQKGTKARLHTGYVVQQIDSACKKHGVDISQYGLYCHEEYPERTEEVEVEQKDGTIKKETRVIEEASEHYSLRYTEALIVECKYLRRCVERLTARIEQLEKEREAGK